MALRPCCWLLVAVLFTACGSSGGAGNPDAGPGDPDGGPGVDPIASWLGHLQFGTTDNDSAYSVIVDSKRNVYVIGASHGDLATGGTAPASQWFVTRLSPSGSRVWTRQWHAGAAVRGAIGKSDELYIVGERGIARLDQAGEIVWDRLPLTDVKDVAVAPDGDLYITGIWTGGDLGSATVFPAIGPLAGAFDGYVMRLEAATGRVKSKVDIGSNQRDITASIAVGDAGEVYVAGVTQGELPGGTHVGAADNLNGFLMRVEANGSLGWTRQFGFPNGRNNAQSVRRDGAGNLYVAGATGGNHDGSAGTGAGSYLARYDSAGTRAWISYFPGSEAPDLAIDPRGRPWTVGQFRTHAFARALDPAGNQVALRFITDAPTVGPGSSTDLYGSKGARALGLAFDGGDFVYLVGDVAGDLPGNVNASALTPGAPPGSDAFVSKLDLDAVIQGVTLAPTPGQLALGAGATGDLAVTAVDARGAPVSGPVSWSSSAAAIATVAPSGRVQAVAQGRTYVTPALGRLLGEPAPIRVGPPWGTVMFGTRHGDVPHAVALDGAGNVVIGGKTDDAFDGHSLGDAFLSKLDAQGDRVWLKQFGGGDGDTIDAMVSDAAGNTYAIALLVDLPGAAVSPSGWVVISHDAAGNQRWIYASPDRPVLTAIAIDAAANVYVTGPVSTSTVVIKLDAAGNELYKFSTGLPYWGRAISGEAIGVDAAGNAYVGGTLDEAQFAHGVLFKVDPTGSNLVWSGAIGSRQPVRTLVVAPGGEVVIAGASAAGFAEDLSGPYRLANGYIARVGADGALKWSYRIGADRGFANLQAGVVALALDSAGNVYGAGSIDGTQSLDVGGALAGGRDGLVLKLDAAGTPVWARQLGTAQNEYATALALRPDGDLVVVGYSFGNLGGSSLRGTPSKANCDVFVAQLGPDGARR